MKQTPTSVKILTLSIAILIISVAIFIPKEASTQSPREPGTIVLPILTASPTVEGCIVNYAGLILQLKINSSGYFSDGKNLDTLVCPGQKNVEPFIVHMDNLSTIKPGEHIFFPQSNHYCAAHNDGLDPINLQQSASTIGCVYGGGTEILRTEISCAIPESSELVEGIQFNIRAPDGNVKAILTRDGDDISLHFLLNDVTTQNPIPFSKGKNMASFTFMSVPVPIDQEHTMIVNYTLYICGTHVYVPFSPEHGPQT